MSKIQHHPILDVPVRSKVTFVYRGKKIEAESGYTIAAALHQAGYPVHSHSLDGRERSLECGIGKCGRCNIGSKYVCKDGPVFRCDEIDVLPAEY